MSKLLYSILQYARPHGGKYEKTLADRLIKILPGASKDAIGNVWYSNGDGPLFTAHMDTVHRKDEKLILVKRGDTLSAKDSAGNPCILGADDGAGIYVLLRLIQFGVKGTYLFTVGEEKGGIGARHAAMDERIMRHKIAVAFDRRGAWDIIIEQCAGPCCSAEFAEALARMLGMGHTEELGTYTDNAEFIGLIPEVCNISVGYAHEHTDKETLDLAYLERLITALTKVDWGSLPIIGPPEKPIRMDWWGKAAEYTVVDDVFDSLLARLPKKLSAQDKFAILDALEEVYEAGKTSMEWVDYRF